VTDAEKQQHEAAEVFHQLGQEAARAMINMMHVPHETSFAATNAASGMINECAAYIMNAVGSANIVAILDAITEQALMKQKAGDTVDVKMVKAAPTRRRHPRG
jgi:hypothetical protein